MNIVYFGTDVFLSTFQYLLKEHNILALYTYHNREDFFTEQNIVKLAHMHKIPVCYEKIIKKRIDYYFQYLKCDLFYLAEYCYKLPVPADLPDFKAVNVHSSLLPAGRSYYPIECAMKRKMSESGITIHKLSDQIDCGDILIQRTLPIQQSDDSIDIYLKCAAAAEDMTKELMTGFSDYWDHAARQKDNMPYWKRPPEKDMMITHGMSVSEAKEIYRCYNKMTKVSIHGQLYFLDSFMPGNMPIGNTDRDIIVVRDNRIIYGLRDGNIRIDIEAAEKQGKA
mgnify:CR=1 FL=1